MHRLIGGWLRARFEHGERGQMLLIFAMLIMPISFAIGVVAVDASVWTSERRGAQKDVDHSALAGALELALTKNKSGAEQAAVSYANLNDESGNADAPAPGANASAANSVVVNDACFPGNATLPLNAVTVNLDHNSRTFFAEAFGLNLAPDIGAHARACVGSITNPKGLRPHAIDFETSPCFNQTPGPNFHKPLFGQECVFDFGAQGSPGGSERGLLDLETTAGPCSVNGGGASDVENNIKFGAKGNCYTNSGNSCPSPYTNCTLAKSGNVSGPVGDGYQYLFGLAKQCDTNGNGRDDFSESLDLVAGPGGSSPNNLYAPKTCSDGKTSERIITIIAVDTLDKHDEPWEIRYFLNIFVTGCRNFKSNPNPPLDPECDDQGNYGHTRYYGILFDSFLASDAGEGGAPNAGPKVIWLDE
jgi:Flp pilus assembly protein TadG